MVIQLNSSIKGLFALGFTFIVIKIENHLQNLTSPATSNIPTYNTKHLGNANMQPTDPIQCNICLLNLKGEGGREGGEEDLPKQVYRVEKACIANIESTHNPII